MVEGALILMAGLTIGWLAGLRYGYRYGHDEGRYQAHTAWVDRLWSDVASEDDADFDPSKVSAG